MVVHEFLRAQLNTQFAITFTIAGELAAGKSLGQERGKWERYIALFRLLGYSPEVGWRFGETYRDLQGRGKLIGANGLWIAATALAHALPVVTRNRDEFSRVTGLEAIGY